MIQAIIASLGILLILVLSEIAWRKFKLRGELARKFVHITAGSFIAFLPFWVTYGWIFWLGLAFMLANVVNRYLGFAVSLGNIVNRSTKLFNAIHAVKRPSWGDVYFGLAISACALLKPSKWVFMAAILQVALADGLAAVVGVSIAKYKTGYKVLGHSKTVYGTATFFITSAIILIVTLALDPSFAAPMSQWPLIILLASMLTAIENIGVFGLDNAMLPLAVVFVLRLL